MGFYSLSNLNHWWEIYAPFQPVSLDPTRADTVSPHRGQVLRYMRSFRQKTKKEVSEALHWSPAFLRKAESSPKGAKTDEHHECAIAHLEIPPHLLGIPIDFFLCDVDGTWATFCEKVIPLVSDGSAEAKKEIKQAVDTYRLNRDPNYLALSREEIRTYEYALSTCHTQFSKMFDVQASLSRDRETNLAPKSTASPFTDESELSDLIRPQEIRTGLRMVDTWIEVITQHMQHAAGLRLDQLIYLRSFFYEVPFQYEFFRRYIDAELGPEKKWEYVQIWAASALYLSNVRLAATPLLKQLCLSLERGDMEQADTAFVRIQHCLAIMCNTLDCFDDALICVLGLDDCITLAKGGMKVKLRNYQRYARGVIDELIEGKASDATIAVNS